jgi:hypothetical protein
MVAVFVVPDFPGGFVLVIAVMSLPWWAGIATLAGAVAPPPGVRRRWRWTTLDVDQSWGSPVGRPRSRG